MRIYVCGPLGGKNGVEYIDNLKKMMRVAIELVRKGHHPYVPCLDILLSICDENEWKYLDYYNFNFAWIEMCEALYYIGSSPGADAELEIAKRLEKKIFTKMEEIK